VKGLHLSLDSLDNVATVPGASTAARVSIPADRATCPDCLREIFDPADRRYRYAFTSCAHCGPGFTIADATPFDRATTSMRGFSMCARCLQEYLDPSDRRFRTQSNACPVCGPRLRAVLADGTVLQSTDAVRTAAAWIAARQIIAVKGLGGFHLACDATNDGAVTELRRRTHDERPFAVMVASLEAADQVALLTDDERRLLDSVERPIVVVRRRPGAPLAALVAPYSSRIELLLPYTPIHHLLLRDAGRPLVMTSGHGVGDAVATGNQEARLTLGEIADVFLEHDRPIVTPADDSVAAIVAGAPALLRRSRGYVPRALATAGTVRRPVLACGGLFENAVAVATGREVVFGPHVGDLDDADTYRSYVEGVDRLLRLLHVTPEIVAHDLQPDYLSSRFARGMAAVHTVGVQHHHAHVVSVMAEHGLEGPIIGVAYDGAGLGTDGRAWGAEILVADASGFTRIGTTRPLPLPGADVAVRQPWRLAIAALDEAFDGMPPIDRLRLFDSVPERDQDVVRQMAVEGLQTPRVHGMSRFFHLAGALTLARPRAGSERQLATDFLELAASDEPGHYPFTLSPGRPSPWQLDFRPAIRRVVLDMTAGTAGPIVAARFLNTVARATAAQVRAAADRFGPLPVVLAGDCFRNRRLTELVIGELREHTVFLNRQVPPGDGGLALGQAVIADRLAAGQTGGW
jgi:hydrogenase maturation protein HypF